MVARVRVFQTNRGQPKTCASAGREERNLEGHSAKTPVQQAQRHFGLPLVDALLFALLQALLHALLQALLQAFFHALLHTDSFHTGDERIAPAARRQAPEANAHLPQTRIRVYAPIRAYGQSAVLSS